MLHRGFLVRNHRYGQVVEIVGTIQADAVVRLVQSGEQKEAVLRILCVLVVLRHGRELIDVNVERAGGPLSDADRIRVNKGECILRLPHRAAFFVILNSAVDLFVYIVVYALGPVSVVQGEGELVGDAEALVRVVDAAVDADGFAHQGFVGEAVPLIEAEAEAAHAVVILQTPCDLVGVEPRGGNRVRRIHFDIVAGVARGEAVSAVALEIVGVDHGADLHLRCGL